MVSGTAGFLGRYASSVMRVLDYHQVPYDPANLEAMVTCLPPPEFNVLAYGVESDKTPIVGVDISLGQAFYEFLYRPVDEGTFEAFTPIFVSMNTMALLHQEPDWVSQRAFLAKFGLIPILLFRSDVRWVRGQQVFIADIRALPNA